MPQSMTLMDRAKALVTSKNCAAAALAIVPLAAAPAKAQTAWTLGNPFTYGGFGPGNGSLQGTPIPGGITLSGQFGPISGSDFLNNEHGTKSWVGWQGSWTGTIHAGQQVQSDFDFVVTFTGGTVAVTDDFAGAGIDGALPGMNLPATLQSGVTYDTSVLSHVVNSDVTGGPWFRTVGFTWTNFAPGDTLTFNVPADSSQMIVVPEPASGAVLMLSALALVARRRRTGG